MNEEKDFSLSEAANGMNARNSKMHSDCTSFLILEAKKKLKEAKTEEEKSTYQMIIDRMTLTNEFYKKIAEEHKDYL